MKENEEKCENESYFFCVIEVDERNWDKPYGAQRDHSLNFKKLFESQGLSDLILEIGHVQD